MPPSGVFLFTALFSARERARNYIRDNLYRRNQKVRGPGRRVDSRDCCSLQHVNLFYFPTRTEARLLVPPPPRRRRPPGRTGGEGGGGGGGGKLRESNRTRTVPVSSCEIFCQFTRNFPPPALSSLPPSLPPPHRDLCALAARREVSIPEETRRSGPGPLRYVPRRPRSCPTRA